MIQINDIRVPYRDADTEWKKYAAKICRVREEDLKSARILKKSLDARKKQDIVYLMSVAVSMDPKMEKRALGSGDSRLQLYAHPHAEEIQLGTEPLHGRVVVVGLGPAGLFGAYMLACYGYRPLVIERGRPVNERVRDVEGFWNRAVLDPESNVMFGEGGAGTFSDGKLTSRSKDVRGIEVLRIFKEHGAPEEIEYLAKPHIGTDKLRGIVSAMRESIERMGGEVHFSCRLDQIVCEDGKLTGIRFCRNGKIETESCGALVLAIGQGARDTYRMLLGAGVSMQPKPFAVGCRIEHPQEMINRIQFGNTAAAKQLGAAEYRLTGRSGDRGVYTFCMCPGGKVVASSSGKEQVVVNGMSDYARDAENANAAIIVQVGPEDFGTDPLSGVTYAERLERDAFLLGGGDFRAPASRVDDFLAGRKSGAFGNVLPSYRPGVCPADLSRCLPDYVAEGIRDGILAFSRQMKGYDLADAVLTAVESRSSSPVRILRDEDGESVSVRGIYPVGEGAGYAGGIVSAAIDGMRAAEKIIRRYRPSSL
ncbi:MAG: NAD(P)/FAD-dependent oxidoreductase [Clostridia bacterium]|nr:NAD(P)/FAD-dependent oxidoreductase [Clostridia bacterium]